MEKIADFNVFAFFLAFHLIDDLFEFSNIQILQIDIYLALKIGAFRYNGRIDIVVQKIDKPKQGSGDQSQNRDIRNVENFFNV
jgi:hypothetical protein